MSEWVDLHVSTLMNDTNDCMGRKILGLEHYLKLFLNNQQLIINLLREIKDKTK